MHHYRAKQIFYFEENKNEIYSKIFMNLINTVFVFKSFRSYRILFRFNIILLKFRSTFETFLNDIQVFKLKCLIVLSKNSKRSILHIESSCKAGDWGCQPNGGESFIFLSILQDRLVFVWQLECKQYIYSLNNNN